MVTGVGPYIVQYSKLCTVRMYCTCMHDSCSLSIQFRVL